MCVGNIWRCDVGSVVSGYQMNGSWYLMAKGNPQWPQVS